MSDATVNLVDDDLAIRDSLSWLLHSRAVPARTWESGEAFLAAYSEEMRGCVVLDVRMPGKSGIEIYDELLGRGCRMPVIFLTAHGDVQMAVLALKKGAFDFLEKPFDDHHLVELVLDAMRLDEALRRKLEAEASLTARLAQLTPREREVMQLVVDGDHNKAIASALDITVRTVEVHRARVFEKIGVRSAVELARLLGKRS
jgi:two-component system, LuxR family, response regulator DctR